ncbi:PEP-CTERM sorting domain-containing protein [Aquisphaera insulae]|uniref:PEP-CTERM sorting domain-containing protein n=1 Tax=Aquisphaera insulae TaxID=2712864 RepID=UPI0013EC50A4|nr:PEP-CTERM sorting domain-containing protein [Aquisphaera insulae]
MTRYGIALLALWVTFGSGSPVRAGLIPGMSLNGNLKVSYPPKSQAFNNSTAILSPDAPEFSGTDPVNASQTVYADFTETTLTISFVSSQLGGIAILAPNDNWLFTFTSLPVAGGASIIGLERQANESGHIAITRSAVSSDSITIGVGNYYIPRGEDTASVTFNIEFSPAAVPEPSSLVGSGTASALAALGLAWRRRRPR